MVDSSYSILQMPLYDFAMLPEIAHFYSIWPLSQGTLVDCSSNKHASFPRTHGKSLRQLLVLVIQSILPETNNENLKDLLLFVIYSRSLKRVCLHDRAYFPPAVGQEEHAALGPHLEALVDVLHTHSTQ